jgi:hypothetical protein
VLLGLCGLGYVAFFADRNKEGLVFSFVLFPMVVALGFAGLTNLFFWLATKRSIRGFSNESDLMRVALMEGKNSEFGRMFVAIYRIFHSISMLAAGYVSVCWVIGVILLSRG